MTKVTCKLCGRSYERLVELGPEKVPVWLHDYPALRKCKALRFNRDFVRLIEERKKLIQEWIKVNVHGQK